MEYTKSSKYAGKVYVFGGFLRDLFLGRKPGDIDMLFIGTPEEAGDFSIGLTKQTGDFCQGINPIITNNAIRLCIYKNTSSEMKMDLTPYLPKEGEICDETIVRATFCHRDFAINGIYLDLTTGIIADPANISYKSLENKILTTVSDDYDGIFKGFPIRLYRMFRFQSELGFEIPNKQLEYARNNAWLANFIERERIKIEINRIQSGKFSNIAIKNMKWCNLDPTDCSRSDVFIGDGWYECEPGEEPYRVKEGPYFRWTSGNSILHFNSGVTAIEIGFYNQIKDNIIKCIYNDNEYFKTNLNFHYNSLKIPVKGKHIELNVNTFIPSHCTKTNDNRSLGIYVREIIIYRKDISTKYDISKVPYLLRYE